ncbi:DUF1064 domain-containing protein (plasmid) [Pontibacillus sp. ALD_SL1]|uniref:DUF1064 domain-containing protein n=1 Tax=Pontibacillus sp. ALD_SL1 TaxID=2777185 RepID=UPI001A96BFDC|nr:DUF1064 domain-containing protein [Pontibacillus sp. ALD_SL1]QST02984.1 DUF1064 domain-containing protein [Pontibacillus sp. ALD_SL1]
MKLISIDSYVFRSKTDVRFYDTLKSKKEQGFIHSFFIEQCKEEGKTHLKPLSYTIDNYTFTSKADVDYYLSLQQHKQNGIIHSFELCIHQKDLKYRSKKVIINDQLFDSREEANYYLYLLSQRDEQEILDIKFQPSFELQPAFKKNGKNFQKIQYVADFEVTFKNGKIEYVDVKGMMTPDFLLKRKLFEYKYPDKELKLVKYVQKYGGWITLEQWKKKKGQSKKKEG